MNDKNKIITEAKSVLKQYGVDASNSDVSIVDMGPDNVSLIVREDSKVYFIAADDYLAEDETYIAQAAAEGITNLIPLRLQKAEPGREYVTMFDQYMICKVYRAKKSTK